MGDAKMQSHMITASGDGSVPSHSIPDDRDKQILDSKILTVAEVASLLKVSKKTIYKLASYGKIPHKKIGNKLRFLLPEVITWMKGRDYV